MKQKIWLKYDGDLTRFDWVRFSSENQFIESGVDLSLVALKNRFDVEDSQIHILIATPDVVIREMSIPENIPSQKMKRVIPSLLEEEILSPLEELHTTYKILDKGKILVASISKIIMTQLVEALQQENIYPMSICPLFLAFKLKNNSCMAWYDIKYCFFQLDSYRGFCIDRNQFADFISFYEAFMKDKTLQIAGKLSEEEKLKMTSKFEKIKFEDQGSTWWNILSYTQPEFNLLVEPFGKGRQNDTKKEMLKHGLIVTTLIPIILLTYFSSQYYKLSKINENLSQQVVKIYKELYPKAQDVTSPRQRIEIELKSINPYGKGDFLHFLYYVGEQAKSIKNLDIISLSYHNRELDVSLEADNYNTIDKLIKQLKDKTYEVEQKNTSTEQEKVKSVLIVKRKAVKKT